MKNHIKNYLFAICRYQTGGWQKSERKSKEAAHTQHGAACKLMRDARVIVFICKLYGAMLARLQAFIKVLASHTASHTLTSFSVHNCVLSRFNLTQRSFFVLLLTLTRSLACPIVHSLCMPHFYQFK